MPNLDKTDQKILAELDFDCRQSNQQIGKKVGLSKEVVKYHIDKLIQTGVIIKFHSVINYFKLGIVKYKLYLRLTNINPEKLEEIAQYFFKHPKTEWVALTSGKWDLIVGFLVKNINEFDDEIQTLSNLFSSHIQEKAVTTTLYLAHQQRSFLKGKEKSKMVYYTSKDAKEKADEIDIKILQLLTKNSRLPVTEIAKALNTTARIVQYHLHDLKKRNIILAHKAHLEPRAMNRIFCKIILYLNNVNKKRLNEFVGYCSALPGSVWPQRVMGAWDFELDLELNNYDEFQKVIMGLKEKFPDLIQNHDFCIVSKEYKLNLFPMEV